MFDCTPQDVYALIPEASPTGLTNAGITPETIARWIDELSGRVALRCHGWDTLDNTPPTPPPGVVAFTAHPTLHERFVASARTVVANGAAAYVEAARYPERAAVADSSYQHVLWTRFREGLDELAAWFEQVKDDKSDGVLDDTTGTGSGAAYAFPPPYIPDTWRP